MNLAFHDLSHDDFRYNLRFLDKKRNLIMEGDFVKLVYSDECTAINSLFFVSPLKFKQAAVVQDAEKSTIWFAPYDPHNQTIIQRLIRYEQVLLEEYQSQMMCNKNPMHLLKNQLLSGTTKLYRHRRSVTDAAAAPRTTCEILVKISGVWESNENFGITYKFMET
jgi:hypothetical protein